MGAAGRAWVEAELALGTQAERLRTYCASRDLGIWRLEMTPETSEDRE
jgi:hypothetical protein